MAQTLFDKIWNDHIVKRSPGFPDTLYIDTHFINKETSAGAFDSLRKRDMPVFRAKQTVVLHDPEYRTHIPESEPGRLQSEIHFRNCSEFGIPTGKHSCDGSLMALPGQTIACDPENAHKLGALGLVAIGINEAEAEQVLATQCLLLQKPRAMKIEVNGKLGKGLDAKDINHYLISEVSSNGAIGYFVEFAGDTILSLDMDSRITVCSVSREIGAAGGIIAPDELTLDYLKELGFDFEARLDEEHTDSWKNLFSDETSVFDEVIEFDADDIRPGVYGVGISPTIKEPQKEEPVTQESAGNNNGYNDTDYILRYKDSIEEFERTQASKTLNGVNPF